MTHPNNESKPQNLQKFQNWLTNHYSLRPLDDPMAAIATELDQLHRYPDPEHYRCLRVSEPDSQHPTVLPQDLVGRFLNSTNMVPCIFDETMHDAWRRLCGPDQPFPSFYRAGPRETLQYDLRKKARPLKVGILTAGGLAPGLNTVIHHLVRRHELYTSTAKSLNKTAPDLKILGFRFGFKGLASGDFSYTLSQRNDERRNCYHSDVQRRPDVIITSPIKNSGGSVLGVGRGSSTTDELEDCVRTLEREDIDILYCIGGNGTAKGAFLLSELLKAKKRDTQICVIPKTIDNDVLWAEYSFGVKTAVDRAVEAVEAMYCEARATGRVAIVELMGAKSGFIAANASLASAQCDLCLIPEVHPVVDVAEVASHLARRMDGHYNDEGVRFAVIVIAEGCEEFRYTGDPKVEMGGSSPAERLHLLLKAQDNARFGDKVVVHRAGYVVRSCAPNPSDRLLCRKLAGLAVDNALGGFSEFVITPTAMGEALVPLKLVADVAVGGLGGAKKVNRNGRFWAEVMARNEQASVDRACGRLTP